MLGQKRYTTGEFAKLFARLLEPGLQGYAEAQESREAIRRVLAYACARRSRTVAAPPRDPFSRNSLIVRREADRLEIRSVFRDRKDDDGAPLKGRQGDFTVRIPLP